MKGAHPAAASPLALAGGWAWRATVDYPHFALLGLIAGTALSAALNTALDQPLLPLLTAASAGLAAAWWTALIAKAWSGEERLVHYRGVMAALVGAALAFALLDAPVTAGLDTLIPGLGLALAFGRLGCHRAGCCHGRPCAVGRRPPLSADALPPYLTGVRLWPVQWMEALLIAVATALATQRLLGEGAAGGALADYLVLYASGRFFLEFLRGDRGRPEWRGLSESQWWSLAVLAAVSGLEAAGALPASTWHGAATPPPFISALWAVLTANRPERRLDTPDHLAELAAALAPADGPNAPPRIHHTSAGYRISTGESRSDEGVVRHYTLSHRRQPLSVRHARRLARRLRSLLRFSGPWRLVAGTEGGFHLLLPTPEETADG